MNLENKKYSPERLKDYALWYYFRYYPSNARLLQKLKEKGAKEDAQKIFREIHHLLQENEIIKAKIDNYIFRNKNYKYIRQKMREKLFELEKVEAYLEQYISSGKSILSEEFIRRKIETYISKGKSKNYILQTLGETKADREILQKIFEENFYEGELENIKLQYEKIISKKPELLKSGNTGKQKIIQKLLSKGFQYSEIKLLDL